MSERERFLVLVICAVGSTLGCTSPNQACDDTCTAEGQEACRSGSLKVTCVRTTGGCLAWNDGVQCDDCFKDKCSATPGPGKDAGQPLRLDAGNTGELTQEAKSGTRVKAKMLVGEDGSKQWNFGWRDTLRNEDCYFTLAADGKTRCLPSPSSTRNQYWADSSCSTSLVYFPKCDARPGVVTTSDAAAAVGCAQNGSRVFQVGASHNGDPFMKIGSGCTAIPAGTLSFYLLGSEIPAASFVAATVTVE